MGLREAARAHNVPVETLRRRVAGIVTQDCRSGPPTVLTKEEEARLAEYCVTMADMGFGLTQGVMPWHFLLLRGLDETTPLRAVMQGEAGTKVSWHVMRGLLFVYLSLCLMLMQLVGTKRGNRRFLR